MAVQPFILIDGKQKAKEIRDRLHNEIKESVGQGDRAPTLAVIRVGDVPASAIYIRNKQRIAEEIGAHFFLYHFPEETDQLSLLNLILSLNARADIDGILVQMPLPPHIHAPVLIGAIDPLKDVDGFHPYNFGRLALKEEAIYPCTPQGVMHLIKSVTPDIAGLNALVVGRSGIVGRPMAQMLLNENCTVTIAHSHTKNLKDLCKKADILVAAIGKPRYIQGSWIKKGAVVIDVGINYLKDRTLCGDVDFDEAKKAARAITPVPGGVGPMTIAMIFTNLLKARALRKQLGRI